LYQNTHMTFITPADRHPVSYKRSPCLKIEMLKMLIAQFH